MKAMRYHAYGDSDVLVYEDVTRPIAAPGQVLVKVAGTSFNSTDAAIRAGLLQDNLPLAFPHVPNPDVSGVITEVGEAVTGWTVGDAVIALLPADAPGAAAEYVAAPAEVLAAAPHSIELVDASALPWAALTAWQSVFEHADLKSGHSVLINGAGGAVGGYAVQLAAGADATVTATAGPRSRDRIRSHGADHIVDYTTSPVPQAVAGRHFDVVLNMTPTSPEANAQLVDLVADGGAFVSITTPGPVDAGRGVRTVHVFVRSDADQLAQLVARVDNAALAVDVAERLPLADLAKVHARYAAQLAEMIRLVTGADETPAARATERAAVSDEPPARRPTGKTVLIP